MSRGYGRTQRAILEIFQRNRGEWYSVSELRAAGAAAHLGNVHRALSAMDKHRDGIEFDVFDDIYGRPVAVYRLPDAGPEAHLGGRP